MPCCGARWLPAAGRLVPCAARRALRARLRCSVLVCPPRRRHRAPRDGPSPREQRFVLGGNDGRGRFTGSGAVRQTPRGNAGPHGRDCARAREPRRPTALHAGPWVRRCLPRPVPACGREVPPLRAARCGRGCLELKPDLGAAFRVVTQAFHVEHREAVRRRDKGNRGTDDLTPGRQVDAFMAIVGGRRLRVPLQPDCAREVRHGPARCGSCPRELRAGSAHSRS